MYTRQEFEENYYELYQTLCGYFGYYATDEQFFDDEVILGEYFADIEDDVEDIKLILSQAKEVLALDPFPEEFIRDLTNTKSPIETRKEWLEGIASKLEAKIREIEARNHSI